MTKAVLLLNLGTPESPSTRDVRKYLSEFLNDSRVIDLPWLSRKLLVNMIIVPFRSPKSAKLYKEIWTSNGSPLLINTENLKNALQSEMSTNFDIKMAMRYGNPSISKVLSNIKKQHFDQLIIIPLYPQYASSTTGSSIEMTMKILGSWKQLPEIKILNHFHNNPLFIDAFVQRIKQYSPQNFDHIIMSYHGLPLNQINEAHKGETCNNYNCNTEKNSHNKYCYLASCYETSRLLAEKLDLQEGDYTVSFQSRLNKNWASPFTDVVAKKLALSGKKRILLISPAFVSDCLETIHELGKELKKEFIKNGGEELILVESLNDFPLWVENLSKIIKNI